MLNLKSLDRVSELWAYYPIIASEVSNIYFLKIEFLIKEEKIFTVQCSELLAHAQKRVLVHITQT